MIGIYKITSPSGKIYIGQTRNFAERLKDYKSLSTVKGQRRLYNSFVKYGKEHHLIEFIEECEFEHLYIRERHWQDFYNVIGKNGLNCKLERTDKKPEVRSEETKRKLSLATKGRIQSQSEKDNRAKSNTGKKRTPEQCKRISESLIGKPLSYEHRMKMRLTNHSNKKVLKISTGEIFISGYDAARKNNTSIHTMTHWLKGRRRKGTADYKYIEDDE